VTEVGALDEPLELTIWEEDGTDPVGLGPTTDDEAIAELEVDAYEVVGCVSLPLAEVMIEELIWDDGATEEVLEETLVELVDGVPQFLS
jgi:hypothetical protein